DEDLLDDTAWRGVAPRAFHAVAADYREFAAPEPALVVRNEAYRFSTPGGSWLALNPTLARAADWWLAADGWFRWTNNEEVMMAESFWRDDGFTGQRPPHFDDEVCRGWYV